MFAHRTIRSSKKHGRVDKIMYPVTGPWVVTGIEPGGSYLIRHLLDLSQTDKKHASQLSGYPVQLVMFEPVDGPNNRYGQINVPIGKNPFAEAGI